MHLPPKIVITAAQGKGVERIRLLLDPQDSSEEGLALLGSLMPQVVKLDHQARVFPDCERAQRGMHHG